MMCRLCRLPDHHAAQLGARVGAPGAPDRWHRPRGRCRSGAGSVGGEAVLLGVEGAAAGGGPVEGAVAVCGHGPAVAVGDAVVEAAEAGEVPQVGGSAVVPPPDVVEVGVAGGDVASGEDAAAVAVVRVAMTAIVRRRLTPRDFG